MTQPDPTPDTVFIFKGESGEHYWQWRAHNYQIIAIGGEGFRNVQDILDIVGSFTRNGLKATIEYDASVTPPKES